jgi:hypothetical protein
LRRGFSIHVSSPAGVPGLAGFSSTSRQYTLGGGLPNGMWIFRLG